MTSKRTVVVAVAVAVGVVASVLSYVFLNNAQNNAYHNAKLVYAYVITKPIPRTLSGVDAANGGYLEQKKVPAEFRPASAVTNLSAIRDQAADANLPAGEIVVSGMFESPDTIASVAAETVPAGDVAISVSVDQVHGVAGLIQPGDKVDILLDINWQPGDLPVPGRCRCWPWAPRSSPLRGRAPAPPRAPPPRPATSSPSPSRRPRRLASPWPTATGVA